MQVNLFVMLKVNRKFFPWVMISVKAVATSSAWHVTDRSSALSVERREQGKNKNPCRELDYF